jgi:hypothetical protein
MNPRSGLDGSWNSEGSNRGRGGRRGLLGEGLDGDGSREELDAEYVDGGGVGRVRGVKKLLLNDGTRDGSSK